MKKISLALGLYLISIQALATDHPLGLGVVVGEPTALTAEYTISKQRSADFGFGYSWSHSVLLYGDYLFQYPDTFSTDSNFINQLTPYVGVGPELEIYSGDHRKHISDRDARAVFSARVPLGLGWLIPDSPVKLFVELVPLLNIAPGLDVDLHADIGVRCFF